MKSSRLFLACVVWVLAAGSALGNGEARHVLPLFIAGAVMSAVCPVGVIAVWAWQRSTKPPSDR